MGVGLSIAIEIDDHSPDQMVTEGEVLTLSAHITTGLVENSDWKKCTWTRDLDQTKCEFIYKQRIDGWIIEENCDDELSNTKFFGSNPSHDENRLCGIIIPEASLMDDGQWKCRIHGCQRSGCAADDASLKFDNAFMNVEVAPIGSTSVTTSQSSSVTTVQSSAMQFRYSITLLLTGLIYHIYVHFMQHI